MKKIFLSLIVLIILAILVFVFFRSAGDFVRDENVSATSTGTVSNDIRYKKAVVLINGTKFSALIADTDALREKGLGGRKGLSPDEAMLFVFDTSDIYGFWMKDMTFSIDILWLDENFRVVSAAENVSPETYPKSFYPSARAKYVVEFSAGTLKRLGVRAGDSVTIRFSE